MKEFVLIEKNGIYLVSEKSSGVLYPIHVQKLISGNKDTKIYCESKKCIIQKTIAGISDDPTFECVHLKSVNSFLPSQDVILQESSLDYLVSQKRMELTTKNNCIKRKQYCNSEGIPIANAMIPSMNDRWVFISVYTDLVKVTHI